MRCQNSIARCPAHIVLTACVLMTSAACDKVPTLPELMGENEAVEGEVPDQALAPAADQADAGPPVLAETPVKRSPRQIVDEFLATEPRLRTSGQLEQLLQLDTAILEQITTLDLSDSPFHDASANLLARFPELTRVSLSGTSLTNQGMPQVARIAGLQALALDRTSIDGDGLESLADQQQLKELSLVSTPISDSAFSHLKHMQDLEVLRVSGIRNLQGRDFDELVKSDVMRNLRELEASSTGFGYYGLKSLDKLPALEILKIADAQVSDQTLPAIAKCRSLRELDLRNNPIGDAGLRHLARLPNLESLWLAECGVSDAGLVHLRGLKSLKHLDLSGTLCTPGTVRQLKDKHLNSTKIRLGNQEY